MERAIFDNDEIIRSFTAEEKEALFDTLMEMYFHKNFGSLSKMDLETYLFSFYLEHLMNNKFNYDDYTIGKDLGLTLSRVRGLKERKELKYPHEGYDWREIFLQYAADAKYDESRHLIKFSIPDVNVIKDVRYYFERNHQYDEIQLNPKLFACRADAFIEMCKQIAIENGEEFSLKTTDISSLQKLLENNTCKEHEKSAVQKIINGTVEDGIKDLLISATKETLLFVLTFVNPGVGKVANRAFTIIKKSLNR